MQLKKRLLAIAAVISLTVFSFLLFSLLQLFGKQAPLEEVPIAKDTAWMLKFDASNFWKEEAYTVLFDQKDEQFLKTLKQLSDEKFTKENQASLGINLYTDVIVCGLQQNDKSYTILLVDLIEAKAFEQNIASYLSQQQLGGICKNTGIIIIPSNKTSKEELKQILQMWQKSPLMKRESINFEKEDLFAYKQLTNTSSSPFEQLEFGVKHDQQRIEINGKCQFQSGSIEAFNFDLKPTGFYFASRIIPLNFEDTLNKYLPLGSFQFSKINGIVMDFNGIYLEEAKEGVPDLYGYLPIPKMNLIVSCEHPISIESILKACPDAILGAENTLNFGETDYQLKQLDAHTVYIGIDPSTVIKKPQKELLKIKGELRHLITIDGSTFIASLAQNLGPMRVGNEFIKSTKMIDLNVVQTKQNQYRIHGELTFNLGKQPLHEISKFLLALSKN